jgi:hypothetical protein
MLHLLVEERSPSPTETPFQGERKISHDPKTDTYLLVMVGTPEWQRSRDRLPLLQAKLNTYLSFILNGQMKQTYPASAGKLLRLELHCQIPPDPELTAFLEQLKGSLKPYHIPLSVWLLHATGEGRQIS